MNGSIVHPMALWHFKHTDGDQHIMPEKV